MTLHDRWSVAQEYERSFWRGSAERIDSGRAAPLDFYQWRADQLTQRLKRLGRQNLLDGTARVVEVGSGPVGVAGFFPASYRLLVDPLNDFYAANPALTALRQRDTDYRTGTGEALPAQDADFDLAIIENCIDHTRDMDSVMTELRRVLTPGGTLYLTVNNRCWPGYYVHRLLSRLKIDAGHPHTFTPARTIALLERHGFPLIDLERGSFWTAWVEDLRAEGMKQRLKAGLGVSEYLVSVIAERT